MPSARQMTTPVAIDHELIEGRYADLGGYTVAFERFPQDVDPAPYFAGLPGDRCTCPHWGVVTSGQITFRWAGHEETYGEGDAYYAPPGHLPLIAAGTGIVEFSPAGELAKVQHVIGAHMTADRFVHWLETGEDPGDLFAPDAFGDLSLPQWRLQAGNDKDLMALRTQGHPWPGKVTVERLDITAGGWVMQMAERWTDDEGAAWYCREMFRADVENGSITDIAIYCTGDWDEDTVRRHAVEVELSRP
ncbi:hypothetical protein [Paractinoplanes globisporus]|uniref:Cupin domain-containing protein n=1 Tax=Paractinoplanes globisporus TaxID=113565 RepID=A0ABW6W6Q0_9ACTN|nr:hypothetical protein [Actinoplanes globisporus]